MKKKVLFIAKNIPTPLKKSNNVIFTIAKKLSDYNTISFLFPKETVPWGGQFLTKYSYLYNLKSWITQGFLINVLPYIRLPFKNVAFFFLNHRILKKIPNGKLKDIDIIHAHYLFPDGFIAKQIHNQYEYPYIITLRKSDINLLRSLNKKSNTWKQGKKSLNKAAKVLCLNRWGQKFLKDTFEIDSMLIPHGIEKKSFLKHEKHPKDSIIVSVVASCIPTKNIDWVIEAIKKYNKNKEVKLLIIGDGPELTHLKMIGNTSNISFLGKVAHEKVLSFLEKSDIFALPSNSETFGLVYLEAAANYNAIIGFEKQGVWGVFEPDVEMLFANNYDDFEYLLHKLIDDEVQRNDLTIKAYKKAKNLTWEKVIEQYNQVYDDVVN